MFSLAGQKTNKTKTETIQNYGDPDQSQVWQTD